MPKPVTNRLLPREEEEDPRQQEWEEELRQQAAAGWPELTCENHAHDNDDPDAGLVRSDPSVTEQQATSEARSEQEQAWQQAARLQTQRWPSDDDDPDVPDDDDPDVPEWWRSP